MEDELLDIITDMISKLVVDRTLYFKHFIKVSCETSFVNDYNRRTIKNFFIWTDSVRNFYVMDLSPLKPGLLAFWNINKPESFRCCMYEDMDLELSSDLVDVFVPTQIPGIDLGYSFITEGNVSKFLDSKGRCHFPDGVPSYIEFISLGNQTTKTYKHGKLHSYFDLPSELVTSNYTATVQRWHHKGELHRLGAPAEILKGREVDSSFGKDVYEMRTFYKRGKYLGRVKVFERRIDYTFIRDSKEITASYDYETVRCPKSVQNTIGQVISTEVPLGDFDYRYLEYYAMYPDLLQGYFFFIHENEPYFIVNAKSLLDDGTRLIDTPGRSDSPTFKGFKVLTQSSQLSNIEKVFIAGECSILCVDRYDYNDLDDDAELHKILLHFSEIFPWGSA